jgi:hypothetical protein
VSVPIGLRWGAAGTPAALRTTFCGDLALAPLRSAAFRREYPVRRRAQRNRALSVNLLANLIPARSVPHRFHCSPSMMMS